MISVLFPSRGRPRSLLRTITELADLAAEPSGFQVHVAVDPDDRATASMAVQLADVWVAPRRFGYAGTAHYYNNLRLRAGGEWLMLWGDDARMCTKGWDKVIREHPRQAVLWPEDNGFMGQGNCFPVVPAAWCKALGRFTPSAHPDNYWSLVGNMLGRHDHIPVSILHDRKDLTGGHDDATYAEGRGLIGPAGYFDIPDARQVWADCEVIRCLPGLG